MQIDMLQRRARQIAHAGLELAELCLELDALARAHVDYVVASWSTHDPGTTLFTSCTMTGVAKDPEGEARIFACEFSEGEPSTYRSLIAEGRTVAILSEVTDGELGRASRFRELFQPVGITDELRAVLWADGTAWGSATLLHAGGRFSTRDADLLAAIGPAAGDGIRLALLRAAARRPEAIEEPPGIVEAQPDGTVTALTTPAQRWLDEGGLPLVTAVNVLAAAVRARRDWVGAASRVVVSDGCVLSLHGASMTANDKAVAVIVELARPAEVRAMLVDAYGLTRRQRDVLGHLLLGRSIAELARLLAISEHTANDHRKAIYQRMGVSSRSQLAALLQSEQYDPPRVAGHPAEPLRRLSHRVHLVAAAMPTISGAEAGGWLARAAFAGGWAVTAGQA